MRLLLLIFLIACPALHLVGQSAPEPPKPASVLVVANSEQQESVALAEYYAAQRGIPSANIVLLPMPGDETVSWTTYVSAIHNPLRAWLKEHRWIDTADTGNVDPQGRTDGVMMSHRIGYIVLCKGVPMRIKQDNAMLTSEAESAFVRVLGRDGEAMSKAPTFKGHLAKSHASVDSELAAMPARENLLVGVLPNPYYRNNAPGGTPLSVIRTARLDGPTFRAARALVDGAQVAERLGLRGRAYIDSGGPYKAGDQWLETARKALEAGHWDVTVDTARERFAAGVRFDAPAFYMGWHTPNVEGPFTEPGFRFPPGAVAVHLHSYSATTLLDPAKYWTGPLVDKGAAATIGNVNEPTLGFTHNLDVLAVCVLSGWSWGDAAWCAMPVVSWQGVVIGDPLYVPMKVDLDHQLRLLDDPDNVTLAQYPVIRAMRALKANGRADEALQRGETEFGVRPGLALALELARMEHAAGNEAAAVARLDFLRQIRYLAVEDQAVALDAAQFLLDIRRHDEALAVLRNLRALDRTSPAISGRVKAMGLEAATAKGDIAAMSEWQ